MEFVTDSSVNQPTAILIADDDPWACKAFRRMLESYGHTVHIANDGSGAQALLQSRIFDAVIMDIMLGDDDGIALLEQKQDLNADTPVILITGRPTVETASAAVRLNAYDYLSKPVSKERLCHAVTKAVEFKQLHTVKRRMEKENLKYQRELEDLLTARTEKLSQSNYRFQLLFENSKDAIFMASWEGKFLELNRSTVALFGYHRDALLRGDPAVLCADPHQYERFRQEIEQKGFVKDFSVKFTRKDGTIIDCLLTANLINRSIGGIEGFQGIIRDITPQKRAEEKIKAQNTFLTNVIESMAHPFMVINAADYTVEIANAAALRKFPDLGNTCYSRNKGYMTPCSQLGRRCILEDVVRSHRAAHGEYHHVDERSGEEEYEEVHAYPLFDDEGHVKQVIQYRLDITHRKRLEAVAEAANLMENLGFIFSGIRHEIGNPINSIKMALSVLSRHLDTYPPETVRQFVERALGEVTRVEYLLTALKNFSLFETPDVELVEMGDFMRHFISLVEKDFEQKRIEIRLKIPERKMVALFDERAFHQVMLNLLTNSADALENRENPRIVIAISAVPEVVQVQVTDNGCGMQQSEQNNLFRPFYTSKAKGTGLGLVIVKKMLAKMNGTISIRSKKNEGTTITMTLPDETYQENAKP